MITMRRRMRYFILASLAVVVGVGAIIGCGSGSDEKIVAVVDGEEIPMSLINNYFDRMGYQFESPEEEYKVKREAVDSLIDYKLLVKGGYSAGLATDPQIERLMYAERPKFLFDALYKTDVGGSVEVTDDEVDEFYEGMKHEREVSLIVVATKETADSLYEAIVNGADFGEIARLHSIDNSTAVNGGNIGFVNWGAALVPVMKDKIFSLEVGAVSEPFETDNGWNIIRVTEERERDLMPKKQMLPVIRQTLRQRRAGEAERRFIEQMKEKAAVQINPEATAMLMEKLDMFYPDSLSGVPRPENYFPQLELLEPYEQQMVFASYAGGELTVEQYLQKIEEVPDAYRPRFDNHEGLRELIFQIEMNNIMEYEADNRDVDITEEYQERVENFRDGLVAEKFRRDVLGSNIDVTDDEVVEYYNQNLEQYTIPPQYHLLEIEVTSMGEAQDLVDQLRGGANFKDLASEHTTRTGMRSVNGDLGFVSETRFPELYEVAQTLDINQVSEPIVNSGGHYSVIKLLEVKPQEVVPLERVQNQIREEIKELRRSSAALDWLAQAREEASIEIREDVIEETLRTSDNNEQS